MFIVARMVDTVRLPPHLFGLDFQKSLERTLNQKLANKIVLDVGLCICFYDFEKVGKSLVLPGDGASHTKVEFRFVVFRPFIDEILTGKVRSCSREGLHLSMGFFDDIFVPADKLPEPSKFQESEQVWIWEYQTEDGPPAELFIEPGSQVRFRVVDECFVDTQPLPGASNTESAHVTDSVSSLNIAATEENLADRKQAYTITASMSDPGLGCLQWWTSNEESA